MRRLKAYRSRNTGGVSEKGKKQARAQRWSKMSRDERRPIIKANIEARGKRLSAAHNAKKKKRVVSAASGTSNISIAPSKVEQKRATPSQVYKKTEAAYTGYKAPRPYKNASANGVSRVKIGRARELSPFASKLKAKGKVSAQTAEHITSASKLPGKIKAAHDKANVKRKNNRKWISGLFKSGTAKYKARRAEIRKEEEARRKRYLKSKKGTY